MKNRLNSYDNMRHWLCICLMQILLVGVGHAEPSEVFIKTVAMEAANQSAYGRELVAIVILNRAKRQNKTVEEVCKAPRQFSCWNSEKWASAWDRSFYSHKTRGEAIKAIERAIASRVNLPNITHYHTVNIMPYWAKGHKPAIVAGDHAFYEGIK